MAKITRATQKIFGENAATAAITTFGTAKATTPNNSRNPADIQTATYLTGWANALEADFAPFMEDTNGLCYLFTRQLAYLYQQGIPEWDAGTTYYKNSQCAVVEDNNLVIKRSVTDNNTNHNPVGDNGTYWVDFYSSKVIHTIGEPIITLSSTLDQTSEVWLNGANVSRETYANLFNIYGTTYGAGNGSTTFTLPNFNNRTIWGINNSSFGYISAGLPNITGTFTGGRPTADTYWARMTGAFYKTNTTGKTGNEGINNNNSDVGFSASRSSSIYGNSTTVQPPAIKVRVKTRYK